MSEWSRIVKAGAKRKAKRALTSMRNELCLAVEGIRELKLSFREWLTLTIFIFRLFLGVARVWFFLSLKGDIVQKNKRFPREI